MSGLIQLTEEHEMIRSAARDFAQNEIAPIAAEFDDGQQDEGSGIHGLQRLCPTGAGILAHTSASGR